MIDKKQVIAFIWMLILSIRSGSSLIKALNTDNMWWIILAALGWIVFMSFLILILINLFKKRA